MFLIQTSKMMHNPKVISKAIINRATKGATNQLETPKSTNIISKGSIGNSLAKPERIKTNPTSILNM